MKESENKIRTATQAPQSGSSELRYHKRVDVIRAGRQTCDVATLFRLPMYTSG